MVFEAEASEGEVRQVVSPTLPFPLSLPSYFLFPLSFQTKQWEWRSDPVRGKFPGFPPTNTALLTPPSYELPRLLRAADSLSVTCSAESCGSWLGGCSLWSLRNKWIIILILVFCWPEIPGLPGCPFNKPHPRRLSIGSATKCENPRMHFHTG